MKRFLAVILCICLFIGNTVYAEEIEEPKDLYAQAAVLMDADSGRILFEKNGQEVLAMASTTKIMTCILALEKGKSDDVVTASELAASQPKVHLGMQAGEQFKLGDLLYSLMLESHNDSAVAIAEHIGGSIEEFAKMMNAKAKELGCNDTYFITPNGLDATDENGIHATTASELARIMSYCITESPKKEEFLSITAMPSHSFTNVEGSRTFGCSNHNSFLTMMEGAISGKTGFTGKAGYCYVGALERDGRTFVVALLACGWPNNKNYKWKDTLKLMEYAVENYTYRDLEQNVELPSVVVGDGVPESDRLFDEAYAKLEVDYGDETAQFLLRKDEVLDSEVEIDDALMAPLKQGECVGKLIYSLNGDVIKEYPIEVAYEVEGRDVSWVFDKIFRMYLGF
ncbi:MAG: D-alanyl-D-alanine carboxypeptidase [Tyzzerella sp.]|nr:D-alanyl-D-alanine carboxypeptidase [Tyzzerella sp.]